MGPLLLLALLGPLAGPEPLERLVSFDEPRQCILSPQFGALLARLSRFDETHSSVRPGPPFRLEGLGEFRPVIDEAAADWLRISVPLAGSWHGLALRRIENVAGIESGPNDVHLVFADPPAVALERLNALGFDLPGAGLNRLLPGEVIDGSIGLHPYEGGSVLRCGSD